MSALLTVGGAPSAIAAAPGQRMLPRKGERIALSPAETSLDASLIGGGARVAALLPGVIETPAITSEAPLHARPHGRLAGTSDRRSTTKLALRLGAAAVLHVAVVVALVLGPSPEPRVLAGAGGLEVALYVESVGSGMPAVDATQPAAAPAPLVSASDAQPVKAEEAATIEPAPTEMPDVAVAPPVEAMEAAAEESIDAGTVDVADAAMVEASEARDLPPTPAETPIAAPAAPPVEAEAEAEAPVESPPAEPVDAKPVPIKEVTARDAQAPPKKKAMAKAAQKSPAEPKSKVAKVAPSEAKPTEPAPNPATETARAEISTPSAASPAAAPVQLAALASSDAAAPAKGGPSAAAPAPSVTPAGDPSAKADYVALLQAWLERYKDYPRRAQMRNQEGTALLFVALDGDGHVLEYRLARSTGFDLLDDAAREMIERAQPLPKVPAALSGGRVEFLVPVRFALR